MANTPIPVITIDGPSGSGKGTLSRLLANELGWHFLDSGALYRLVALAARRHAIPFDDEAALQTLAAHLDVQFASDAEGQETTILLEGEEVTNLVRSEECGNDASKVAVIQSVRDALLGRQRAFCQPPGLIADGRDMGTVIFPDAKLKVFLDASLEERTARRYRQLREKGIDASIDSLFDELAERDRRDRSRAVSPLKPAPDAVTIDSSALGIQEVLTQIRQLWQRVKVQ